MSNILNGFWSDILNNYWLIIIIVVVALLLAIGTILYFFVFKKKINEKIARNKEIRAQKIAAKEGQKNLASNVFKTKEEDTSRREQYESQKSKEIEAKVNSIIENKKHSAAGISDQMKMIQFEESKNSKKATASSMKKKKAKKRGGFNVVDQVDDLKKEE